MRINWITLFGLALCGAWAGAQRCWADTAAVSFTSPNSLTTNSGTLTLGYEFQANQVISVTQLGLFDYDNYGVGSTNSVGLWNSRGTLLASTSISSSGTQEGLFTYAPITPVALVAGQDYYVAGVSSNMQYTQGQLSGFTIAPQISYVHDAYAYTTNSALVFPSGFDYLQYGYFGGNFEFTDGSIDPAPLPAPLGAGLVLLAGFGCWTVAHRMKTDSAV